MHGYSFGLVKVSRGGTISGLFLHPPTLNPLAHTQPRQTLSAFASSSKTLLFLNQMDPSAITVVPGMDMPIMHDSDRYELVRDIGSGNFGVARLMRDKLTEELVAVKYIERGEKVCHLPSLSFFSYL